MGSCKSSKLSFFVQILTALDAIQSEDSHFVTWLAHMMAGNSGRVSWSLLKGELGINEERKMPGRETENENKQTKNC